MNTRKLVPRAARPVARSVFDRFARATSSLRTKPDFIVIGGQRCGTTTIFKSLSEHPQVIRPVMDKGTDYYTLNYFRGLDWYQSRFPTRRVAAHKTAAVGPPVVFEACTYYMFHPLAIERLAADFPDVKLVAMLRDPVERAFSAYKHEYARGFDTEPDFRRALELEDARLAGELEKLADPRYESFPHRHHAYRHRGQFAEQLQRVLKYYPRSQLHVMDSEAFFADPAAEYRDLVDFLGLEPWEPAKFEQHNARPSSAMPADAKAFLEEHYSTHDQELAELLGRKPFWTHG